MALKDARPSGQVRRTTQNLEVIQVREADKISAHQRSHPRREGDYVVIRESKKRARKGGSRR